MLATTVAAAIMNINKKLDRVRQWAGEKMGAESKTNVSEEFKALEMEMSLRHEGMDRLHKSMTTYVKSMSKRNEADDKEKILPVAFLGQTMAHHGEDFEPDSEFGNCLIGMGRANDKLARIQDTYVAHATTIWLESLERSLVQMKEYQGSRKKLEQRRLAYDTSISKMQKAKKEDYRVEEELRSQKAKYEEASEDVLRRMQDIKESEADSIADLGSFLDAELEYYDRCRDELLKLKKQWPAGKTPGEQKVGRNFRSRSETVHTYGDRFEEAQEPEVRPSIRSRVTSGSRLEVQDHQVPSVSPHRPAYGSRPQAFQGPTVVQREPTPVISRDVGVLRGKLRPTNRIDTIDATDAFGDPSDDSTGNSTSPDYSYRERSVSPATSHGSSASQSAKYSITPGAGSMNARKGPPPPPPSRNKKPPPPLPMKRAEISY